MSKKQLTIKNECGNIYKLSARKSKNKEKLKKFWRNSKKIQKTLKKCLTNEKTCGRIDKLTSWGGQRRAVARVMQIKNGIRKKWDLFDKQANESNFR